MKIKFSTNVDNYVNYVENYYVFHVKQLFKLTTVCYLINERSLIRFLCVGKERKDSPRTAMTCITKKYKIKL